MYGHGWHLRYAPGLLKTRPKSSVTPYPGHNINAIRQKHATGFLVKIPKTGTRADL